MICPNKGFAKILFANNIHFKNWFENYVTLALNAWSSICPDIANKLENRQYDDLDADIQKVMDDVCKKHGNTPISLLTANDRKMLPYLQEDGWKNTGATSSKEAKLFLIGEIFIQIQWLWHLIPEQDNTISRSDAIQIFSRATTLGILIENLSSVCVHGRNAKTGGEKRSVRQARCRDIIQSPEHNIRPSDAQKHLAETIQKIKDVYFEIYGESLQKPNKKAGVTPCDKTITNWIYEFTTNNLPDKRA